MIINEALTLVLEAAMLQGYTKEKDPWNDEPYIVDGDWREDEYRRDGEFTKAIIENSDNMRVHKWVDGCDHNDELLLIVEFEDGTLLQYRGRTNSWDDDIWYDPCLVEVAEKVVTYYREI